MIKRIKRREKIAFLLVTATLLTTGFPALKFKKDTRLESYEFPSSWLDERDAVVALIPLSRIEKDRDAQVWRTRRATSEKTAAHEKSRFTGQLAIADCTGFLIEQDLLVTASRCIPEQSTDLAEYLTQTRVARTLQYYSASEAQSPKFRPSVLDSELISMREVIYRGENDFALIRLEHKFDLARPLKLKHDFPFGFGTKVVTIGHPMGLAKKGEFNALLSQEPKNRLFPIKTTQGASLGQPIFDPHTHGMIGFIISDSVALQTEAVSEKLQELGISFEAI